MGRSCGDFSHSNTLWLKDSLQYYGREAHYMQIDYRLCTICVVVVLAVIASAGFAAAEEKVHLDYAFWIDAHDRPIFEAAVEEFEENNPHIEVQISSWGWGEFYEKMLILATAGDSPDVFGGTSTWIPGYIHHQMVMNLEPFINSDSDFDRHDFFPSVMEGYSDAEGNWIGLPYDASGMAYFANLDMIEDAGLFPPFDPWSWDDLVGYGRKLTRDTSGDGQVDQFALPSIPCWGSIRDLDGYLRSFGARTVSRDGREFVLNSSQGINAIQFFADLRWVHHIAPQPGESASFQAGTAAMYDDGPWAIIWRRADCDFNWDITYIPGEKRSGTYIGSGFFISSKTSHPQEAWLLLKHMTSTEFLSKMIAEPGRGAPGRISSWEHLVKPGVPPQRIHVLQEELMWLEPTFPNIINFRELSNNIINPELWEVWDGRKSAAEVLHGLKPVVDAFLAEEAKMKR